MLVFSLWCNYWWFDNFCQLKSRTLCVDAALRIVCALVARGRIELPTSGL